jgi:hydroxysqualene synthase
VPREAQVAFGASEADLEGARLPLAWVRTIDSCIAVTRERFVHGRAVCDGVRGRLRSELRFTWLGGSRLLERIARRPFDLLGWRPTLRLRDAPLLLWLAVRWASEP